jgi:NADH:ubiquinone oxidoreductase subunit 2 (subunit N)
MKGMTNEEKLDAIYEMTKENHEVLLSIRRQQYVASATRILYWLVVLGVVGGAYYYVRPLVILLSGHSGKVEETVKQISDLKNQLPEAKLFHQVMNGLKPDLVGTSSKEIVSTTSEVQ